jgi:hypothetical protein
MVPEKPCNAGGLDTSWREERECFMCTETRGGKFAGVGDGGSYWSTPTSGLIPAAVRETAIMLFRTTCGGVTLVVMKDETFIFDSTSRLLLRMRD